MELRLETDGAVRSRVTAGGVTETATATVTVTPVNDAPLAQADDNAHGLGRDLFGGMRRTVRSAEEGAITWL